MTGLVTYLELASRAVEAWTIEVQTPLFMLMDMTALVSVATFTWQPLLDHDHLPINFHHFASQTS